MSMVKFFCVLLLFKLRIFLNWVGVLSVSVLLMLMKKLCVYGVMWINFIEMKIRCEIVDNIKIIYFYVVVIDMVLIDYWYVWVFLVFLYMFILYLF